jgi:hypothetical protein
VRSGDELLLYYVGWQLGVRARYFLFAGLAVSDNAARAFVRNSQAPLLDRTDGELFVRSAPSVLHDGEHWKMWYIAGDSWIHRADGVEVPVYSMRYLESSTPKNWRGRGLVCMEPDAPSEIGFGRPVVVKQEGVFGCWYSVRTLTMGYRIGYAESVDGLSWTRLDDRVGIDVSDSGWDSEMICFPWIQRTPHGTYMFYNGNNYGETGFGAAVLES